MKHPAGAQWKIFYSADVDAMIIGLRPDDPSVKGQAVRSLKLAPDTVADFDKDNRLISIEILNVTHHYPEASLEGLGPPVIALTLAQASQESGLSVTGLRAQIMNGKLKGFKRGRDWMVYLHELWNYMERREPVGRPPRRRKARRRKVEAR